MVRKAIVLAAGFGTRLKPFTATVPKPLMPIWGEAMLARIVTMLRDNGVEEIAINAHCHAEQIVKWGNENGCKVNVEETILGSGGALNQFRDFIGNDPFYLVNGDIVLENIPDLQREFAQIEQREEVLGVCLATTEGPRTIEAEPEYGYVTNWHSDDAGYEGTFTYCGCSIIKSTLLKYIPPQGASHLIGAYEKAMMDGHFMKTVLSFDLLWEDAGTLERYLALNSDGKDNAFAMIPHLSGIGANDFKFMFARGSERAFFRCERGIVVVYDDSKRSENARYAGHARWLKAKGINVPEVVFDDPKLKTTVYSDAGEERKMSPAERAAVIDELVRFNRLGAATDLPELEPGFDEALWRWERELFVEQMLKGHFGMELAPEVEAELKSVADRLEREPRALVHRDFQSTNVLWREGKPVLIDFQGMRLGPAAYDLASFVYDPYVVIGETERAKLIELYAQKAARSDIAEVVPFAAVQRLVQCLGAYGRLVSVGQKDFAKYVLPALERLLSAADEAGLDAVGALAEDLIARERKLKA